VSIVLTSYNAKNNRLNRWGDCVTKGTSSDDLFKALNRYLEESGEPERSVASRIGINHHILSRLNGKKDGKEFTFPLNLSLTVAKKDGKWLIAAMHFSTLTGDSATGTKDTQ
jgi:hypothetical protein